VARATLGGAMSVARQLPSQDGTELVTAAQAAFSLSLELTAGICAAVIAVMAVVMALKLRTVRPAPANRSEDLAH
jgi:DHA2 family multidrug resistance protein-like MFS transporter